jgi:ArsR family transcriptional regulator, arsenate/arsenite/antimonite-responsive transcriptional repressor
LAWTGWFRALGDASRVLILNDLAIARRPMTVEGIVDAMDGPVDGFPSPKLLVDPCFVLVERRGNTSWFRVNER